MEKTKNCICNTEIKINTEKVEGKLVEINNELLYQISNYDKMKPFLVNVVSSSNHWFYISSNGGLTAGRKNSDNALFPYYNDDIIHKSHHTTGSKTIIKVTSSEDKIYLWEPFSENYYGLYKIKRNLYKNIYGTKIIFEEINEDLNLTFSYSWANSDKYGFVKESKIKNNCDAEIKIEILDGIQNILPSGIYQKLQTEYSTLIDAYKKNELIYGEGIGIFGLSSVPTDRAEPSESLTATIIWTTESNVKNFLLSDNQLSNFRNNFQVKTENEINGTRGAYFITSVKNIAPKEISNWLTVADINQDVLSIKNIKNEVKNEKNIKEKILLDVAKTEQKLVEMVAKADGLQCTNKKLNVSRHFSNVLFNIMRGGIFADSYNIDKTDFISFIKITNPYVLEAHKNFLNELEDEILHSDLFKEVEKINDSHFTKLVMEYLPLTFSRRHGDPSRPWNKFSIELKDKYNQEIMNYQGNWRDIFQNWEALALSYPNFIESMMVKFLNASTADGYNPYRVTKDGFDWETVEPDNPWANIGYWGDHQIIYLTKLLELSSKYNPGTLNKFITKEIFSYANVPYRIKSYKEILQDPNDTIIFNGELDEILKNNSELHGTDSKFVKKKDHTLVQVNLTEKLLVMLLVKMSNFIPDGGIWMNTQRPEWNDANNALVGNGISMVTLYYIRRFLIYMESLFGSVELTKFNISEEVAHFFYELSNIFSINIEQIKKDLTPKQRKKIVDLLGYAGSRYRENFYNQGFSNKKEKVTKDQILNFIEVCKTAVDESIKNNKREDGLYHSYNLMDFNGQNLKILSLCEMLEGQVAVLSSNYLSENEAIEVLESLKKSKLYREDQNSYILYPDRKLPNFIEKNNIPKNELKKSKSLIKLLDDEKNEIIHKDVDGEIHFHNDIRNANILIDKLLETKEHDLLELIVKEKKVILDIYEAIFNHSEFTGRSGTFYKYEGLGSIYWHMVSKLLLAVQEVYFNAEKNNADAGKLEKLRNFYYDIKAGIGVEKSPELYGAFPTDAYSHTPFFLGAQQPGMTGQVKEDVISRFREIGVDVFEGKIFINTSLLNKEEFLESEQVFNFYNVSGEEAIINCPENSLAITYCQVPFLFNLAEKNEIIVHFNNGKNIIFNDSWIDEKTSQSIFNREGKISKVEIFVC